MSDKFGELYGFYDCNDGYFKVYEAYTAFDDDVIVEFVGDFVSYEEANESIGSFTLVDNYNDIYNEYLA